MKSKLIFSTISIITMFFIAGFFLVPVNPPANVYNLKIIKIDGTWKVVDASDYSKTKIRVKKKDIIVWTAEGTDVYFQFPGKLFNPTAAADSLKDGYTKFLKDGKKLKLKVRSDALSGIYEYAVFCTANGEFAKGESPPKIVID